MEDGKIRNHRNRAGDSGRDAKPERYEIVRKADDESIDDSGSEVGWNSEDEQAINVTKSSGRNKKGKKKTAKYEQYEDEDGDYESDQEEPGEGEILLSDLLLKNLDSATAAKFANKKRSGEMHDKENSEGDDDDSDGEVDEMDDEDDDQDDDQDEDDEDEDDDEEEDEEDDELDHVHSRLISAISKFSKSSTADEGSNSQHAKKVASQGAAESSFSSLLDNGEVSMNALLGALDDSSRGLGVVKKHLAELERGLSAPKHLEKVTSERMERTQTYEGSRADMGKWQETVTTNRHVRTLDLAQDKRQLPSAKALVHRFVPTTDMEREVQMVLAKQGADSDQAAVRKEEDELQSRSISLQEMRERQAELAKVKALMFYEQMKRHRLNKIKSKAYRKIQKRKKFRAQQQAGLRGDDDDEEAAERAEKNAYDRVKERMDLRHKNTSKWARMALKHGHADKSLREAYHESVRLGHELATKMNEEQVQVGDSDDDDALDGHSDNYGDGDDDDGAAGETDGGERVSGRAARAVKRMLTEQESAAADQASAAAAGRYRKLFEMDFMKKAAEEQREKAREEAKDVLREIEEMERQAEADYDSDDNGRHGSGGGSGRGGEVNEEEAREAEAARRALAKKEVKQMMSDSAGHGMLLGDRVLGRRGWRKGAIVLNANNHDEDESGEDLQQSSLDAGACGVFGGSSSSSSGGGGGGSLDSAGAGLGAEEGGGVDGFEENPWLLPATKSAASGSSSGRSKSGTGAKKDLARTGENEVFISVLDPKTSTAGAVAGAVRVVGKKGAGSKNSNAHALVGQGAEEQISQVLSSKECTMNGATGTAVVGSGGKMSKSKRKAQSQAQAQAAVGTESSSASEGSKGGGAPKEKLQLLSDTSQAELVQQAFAGPDFESEFLAHKQQVVDDELGVEDKKMKIISQVKAGWGDWAGPGATMVSDKIVRKRDRLLTRLQSEAAEQQAQRADAKKMNVLISQRRVKTAAKFKVAAVPHPFGSREEYERTLQMPLGEEWNSSVVVKKNVQPEVKVRAGRVIEPIKLAKRKNAPAAAPIAAASRGVQEQQKHQSAKKSRKS